MISYDKSSRRTHETACLAISIAVDKGEYIAFQEWIFIVLESKYGPNVYFWQKSPNLAQMTLVGTTKYIEHPSL